uniref:Uncharacterized protein n=1 Tax=Kalanchoe fedtschenkoi TaxID=63787 RepID=A0A7N0VJ72_KALFE
MEAAALMDPPIDFGFKAAALPCSKQILVNGYKLRGTMTPGDSGFSVDVGEYLVDAESPPYWNPEAGSGSGSSSPDGDEAEHDSPGGDEAPNISGCSDPLSAAIDLY